MRACEVRRQKEGGRGRLGRETEDKGANHVHTRAGEVQVELYKYAVYIGSSHVIGSGKTASGVISE